jgi:hypothetical protein
MTETTSLCCLNVATWGRTFVLHTFAVISFGPEAVQLRSDEKLIPLTELVCPSSVMFLSVYVPYQQDLK